jgi:hypothetical protein
VHPTRSTLSNDSPNIISLFAIPMHPNHPLPKGNGFIPAFGEGIEL